MSSSRHAAAVAAALVWTAVAAAPASAASGIGLYGQAPLVCSAGIAAAPAAAATTPGAPLALGQLNEFCNDPDGFDVWIDYPASLSTASLIVDGQAEQLSADGTIVVSHASNPGQASLSLALSGQPTSGPIALTVRLVPTKATALALASIAP